MPARSPLPPLYQGLPDDQVGTADFATIAAAMAAIEQPLFSAINSAFMAYDFLPDFGSGEFQYPISFRTEPEWVPNDRHMGGPGGSVDRIWEWSTSVVILVGLASNARGPMLRVVEPFILPFYGLYVANRTISGTVRKIVFNEDRGRIGGYPIDTVMHYGAEFPVILRQLRSLQ